MSNEGSCLGVSYADHHLFYSVNSPGSREHLQHIGSIDFSFDVQSAIIRGDNAGFPALKTSLEKLKEEYNCSSVKILSPPAEECWTTVPRSVYEDSAEREAHIGLLMHGLDRSDIEATWHPLSNTDFRLLLLRKKSSMMGFSNLLGSFSDTEFVSHFEIGGDWQNHSRVNGSFMIVFCGQDCITASSYILGKLRGCTYIRYDNPSDLPYLWSLYAEKLTWMNGLHDQIYICDHFSHSVSEILTPYWDDSGDVTVMNSLSRMNVSADEKTYGFPLESAFPAIMMSLNTAPDDVEEPA